MKTVQFSLETKTHLGDPVPGAMVYFDQDLIGETDSQGLLKVDQVRDSERPIQVAVKKQSETHYFSDFSQIIVIPSDLPPSQAIPLALKATLFFVPKGSHENEIEKETAGNESESPPTVTPPAKPAPTQPQSTDQDDLIVNQLIDPLKQTFVGPPHSSESKLFPIDQLESLPLPSTPPISVTTAPPKKVVQSPTLVTIHLSNHPSHTPSGAKIKSAAKDQPIGQAKLSLYLKNQGQSLAQCTTNQRGRCVLQLSQIPEEPVLIVASKKGYRTSSQKLVVKQQTIAHMMLTPGHSLDVFTFQKIYDRLIPYPGINVLANQKKVGQTNEYGFLTADWPIQDQSFTQVALTHSRGHTLFDTDFTGSLESPIVKYFAPDPVPPPRIVVAEPMLHLPNFSKDPEEKRVLQQYLRQEFAKVLFKTQIFQEYPLSLFEKRLLDHHQSSYQVSHHGFDGIGLGPLIDGVVFIEARPRTGGDFGPPWLVEAKIVSRQGAVISGAIEEFQGTQSAKTQTPSIGSGKTSWFPPLGGLAQRLAASFPFQGVVKRVDQQKIFVSFGKGALALPILQSSFPVTLYGLQMGKIGDSQNFTHIATGTGTKESPEITVVTPSWIAPRSVVQVGDIVNMGWTKSDKVTSHTTLSRLVKVVRSDKAQPSPLGHAALYGDGLWLGETDAQGQLFLSPQATHHPSQLILTRAGYLPLTLDDSQRDALLKADDSADSAHSANSANSAVSFAKDSPVLLALQPSLVMVSIDSQPQGAEVSVDHKVIGRTPLESFLPIPATSDEMLVQLKLGSGYKIFERKLNSREGSVIWRGPDAVVMETDDLARGDRLVLEGHPGEAAAVFEKIPTTHSDYFMGQIRAGDIQNNFLGQPEKALIHYQNALKHPEAKDLKSATHFNLRLEWASTVLKVYEQNAQLKAAPIDLSDLVHQIDTLMVFLPQAQFATPGDQERAGLQLSFFRSLAQHFMALEKSQPLIRFQAAKSWRTFLKQTADTTDPLLRSYHAKAQRLLQDISKVSISGQHSPEPTHKL